MVSVLGQFNLGGGDVPALRDGPWWQVWTVESPWVVAGALVGAGVVAWWFLNQKSEAKKAMLALGAGVLLAAALVVCAQVVTTTRERLRAKTRELVGAVARAEMNTLSELLAEDVVLTGRGEPLVVGREALLSGVRATTGSAYPVKQASMLEEQEQVDDRNFAYTQVWLRIEAVSAGMARSWWKIGWRREAEGTGEAWRATSIDILQLDFFDDPAKLKQYLD